MLFERVFFFGEEMRLADFDYGSELVDGDFMNGVVGGLFVDGIYNCCAFDSSNFTDNNGIWRVVTVVVVFREMLMLVVEVRGGRGVVGVLVFM